MSWDDLFESRMFSSYVIKSSLDNPAILIYPAYIQTVRYSVYSKATGLKKRYLITNNLCGNIKSHA